MTIDLVHPEGVPRVPVHHQVSVATGSRIVSLAGQVSWDADGRLVGAGDLAAQAAQAYRNVAACLRAVGGTMSDLARVTVYVVDLSPERSAQVMAGRQRVADELGIDLQHPGTFVGVTALFDPDYLIEVEATAVLD